MTAYALARFHGNTVHSDLIEYVRRIQATLQPYGGEFLVHGGKRTVLEGSWPGGVVIIAFPAASDADAWYHSAAYQRILPLRTRHKDADIVIVDGVPPGYDPAFRAEEFRSALSADRPVEEPRMTGLAHHGPGA